MNLACNSRIFRVIPNDEAEGSGHVCNISFLQTEPENATERDKIVTNRPQNTSVTPTSLPRAKTTAAKPQVIQHRSAGNTSSWLQKAWNGISSAMKSVMKWLCYGIEWPKDINTDMFARRTVTRSELTCPSDGVS